MIHQKLWVAPADGFQLLSVVDRQKCAQFNIWYLFIMREVQQKSLFIQTIPVTWGMKSKQNNIAQK